MSDNSKTMIIITVSLGSIVSLGLSLYYYIIKKNNYTLENETEKANNRDFICYKLNEKLKHKNNIFEVSSVNSFEINSKLNLISPEKVCEQKEKNTPIEFYNKNKKINEIFEEEFIGPITERSDEENKIILSGLKNFDKLNDISVNYSIDEIERKVLRTEENISSEKIKKYIENFSENINMNKILSFKRVKSIDKKLFKYSSIDMNKNKFDFYTSSKFYSDINFDSTMFNFNDHNIKLDLSISEEIPEFKIFEEDIIKKDFNLSEKHLHKDSIKPNFFSKDQINSEFIKEILESEEIYYETISLNLIQIQIQEKTINIIKSDELIVILNFFYNKLHRLLLELSYEFLNIRRKYFKIHFDGYMTIIYHFLSKKEEIFVSLLNDIMKKLNIPQNVLDQSFHFYLEVADTSESDKIKNLFNKLNEAGENRRIVKKIICSEQIKNILEYVQNLLLRLKKDNFEQEILKIIIYDHIYFEFGYESEDIVWSINYLNIKGLEEYKTLNEAINLISYYSF